MADMRQAKQSLALIMIMSFGAGQAGLTALEQLLDGNTIKGLVALAAVALLIGLALLHGRKVCALIRSSGSE